MSDDKSKAAGRDRKRISLGEEYEIRDWTETLGVDEAALRGAVQAVGDQADDVREYLKNK
jgi:hypothetical protein